ncbi:MAG: hypothetical protein WBC70_18630 [Candidatus Aminicenantales bacterium]
MNAADRLGKAVEQSDFHNLPIKEITGCDENDLRYQGAVDQLQDFEAVDVRNPDIQKDKIRPSFQDFYHGVPAVGAFS